MESLSRPPHRRKHSTSTANVFSSFSSKNPYDDVLLSTGSGGAGSVGTKLGAQDYAEIFSGSQRGSSIPVLDLSGLDERAGLSDFRSSKLDYSNIFGGFRDEDVAVPYEQLFAGGKTRKRSSDKLGTTRESAGSPVRESNHKNSSGKNKGFSVETQNQSAEATKQQFNMSFNKSGQGSNDWSNGKMHIAQLHAIPGFTSFIDETAHLQNSEGNKPVSSLKRGVSRAWSFSAEVEQNHGKKSEAHTSNDKICNSAAKAKGGSSSEESHVNSKSLSTEKINAKSHDSNVPPPSIFQQNRDEQKGSRRTKSLSFGSKADASEKIAGEFSPALSDEELDVNSVAAASAAALKKAIEQAEESIRIAKEIMDRRRECLQDGSKPSTMGRLRVKDKKEKRAVHEANILKEKNATETNVSSNPVLPALAEVNRRYAPTLGQKEPIYRGKEPNFYNGKIDVEKLQENIETAKEHAVARGSPDLETDSESRTAALDPVQVNNKNNPVHSINKLVSDIEMMEKNENMSEQTELVFGHTKGPENVAKLGDPGDVFDASIEVQEFEETVDTAGENLRISKENDIDRMVDYQTVSGENVKCKEKLEGHQEIVYGEQPELHKLVFDHLVNESENLAKLEKEHPELFRQEHMDKTVESGSNRGKSYHQCEVDYDVEEIASRQEEANLWFKTEEPEEASEKEVSEMEFQEVGSVEMHFAEDNEAEINDKKLNSSQNGDELKIPAEHENEVIDERYAYSEYEPFDMSQMKANKYTEDQKISASLDAEETKSTRSATGKNEDNHGICDFQEAVFAKDFDMSFDANVSDASITVSENRKACTVEENDNGVDGNYRTVERDIENDSRPEQTETSVIETNREKEPVKEIFQQDDNEIYSAASLLLSASEMNFFASKLQNAFESLSSDGNTENSSDADANPEEKLPKNEDAFETADEISNSGQEENANESYMQDSSKPLASGGKTADLGNVEAAVQQSSECDEGSYSISNVEDIDGFTVHETQASEEDAKDDALNKEENMDDLEMTCNEIYVEEQNEGVSSLHGETQQNKHSMETERVKEIDQNAENNNENRFSTMEDAIAKENTHKVEMKDRQQRIEAIKREREREKERIAVERAIREARERAFADARERAERAAVERAAAEARQRSMAEAKEKASTKQSTDKASTGSKLRTERAAVERATAEARERALEKAFSQKTLNETRTQADSYSTEKLSGASRNNALKHSYSSSDLERFDGNNNESAQRRKARLERHQRIMERAAKALAEKNMRDLLAQKEQAERNRLAESLDADIKRWASGKEGNLRALLSTLQYILGPDSGWQPISLTEIITTPAVKKAYRRATLYVHPDKLQQKGASIQQKYICEKVFDLLKAAWNKFNSEER